MPIYITDLKVTVSSPGASHSSPGASHKGWIDVFSWSWGTAQSGSGGHVGEGHRVGGTYVRQPDPVSKVSGITRRLDRHKIVLTTTYSSSDNLFKFKRFDASLVFSHDAPGGTPSSGPRHTLNLRHAEITDIQPSVQGEELTITFLDYYFNGAWNLDPEMVSAITAPFHFT